MNYGVCGGCTTTQPKTHNTVALLVYPWHPWHGKTVDIREEQVRRGCSIYRCVLQGTDNSRTNEIPTWMFSRTVCWAQDLSATSSVSVQSLRELRDLLCLASASVEIQYSSFEPQGDTDATDPNRTETTTAVSPPAEDSQVGAAHARRKEESNLSAGNHASTTSRSHRSRRKGGRR